MSTNANAEFAPTQWSVVLQTRRDSSQRQQALERLCKTYWLPLYGYLRRRGHSPEDAEDLTQGFFAYLLESDFLDRPDPAKGRFRGYLLGALRHYLGKQFERQQAQKRGGGARSAGCLSMNAELEFLALDRPQLDPSQAFEKTWALTLLSQSLQRLEAEQATAKKTRQFNVLKPFLSATPTSGEYDQAARALGTTRTTVAVWVHRLNHRYGEIVKMEVAATVADPAEVKEEMQHLLRALRM
jgi:RNA polymerase sigma-70 factor (ECF subfamily)